MSTERAMIPLDAQRYPDDSELIDNDGVPLETDWHRMAMNLLCESIYCQLTPREDYYVGGNMFIYFSAAQARNRDYRGPDFFFVWGASLTPMRRYWAVWKEEFRYPDVIVELSLPTTTVEDHTVKKDLYERTFRTQNYFCYDPDTQHLEGWELTGDGYAPLQPDAHGRLWSSELDLFVGTWDGAFMTREATWLRFFTTKGIVVPIFAEAEARRAQTQARRAKSQAKRADAAEAEVARLRAELERRKNGP